MGLGGIRVLRNWLMLTMIDRVIPVSTFQVEELRKEIRIPGRKVEMVYNGVDIERFRPACDLEEKALLAETLLGAGRSTPVVTFVGALIANKGIEDFIDVARSMLQLGCKACFVIVGDGELQEAVMRQCGPDDPNLRYLGWRDDVPEILRASDVFVAPYRWKEAFGLTIAEASASGVPIVASDVGAIRELVEHGITGILTVPGSKDAIEAAIERLLGSEQLRSRMGEAARRRAEGLFSLAGALQRTLAIYRRCLSDRGRGAR